MADATEFHDRMLSLGLARVSEAAALASASLIGRDVCPHCKRETDVYTVFCDGHVFETHRCRDHGDVCPMRSHIVNPLSVPAVRHD